MKNKLNTLKKIYLHAKPPKNDNLHKIFKNRRFKTVQLTKNKEVFWKQIEALEEKSILTLYSHGDKDGPLIIDGEEGRPGDDLSRQENIDKFVKILSKKNAAFYLLSCHTGQSKLIKSLLENNVKCVAPNGYAKCGATSDLKSIESIEKGPRGDEASTWMGSDELKPKRGNKLEIKDEKQIWKS